MADTDDDSGREAVRLSEGALDAIMRKYDSEELVVSRAHGDGGTDPLWPRFHRAAINQMSGGEATLSRYAIWANTVRDNIIRALELGFDSPGEARELLVRAANSLSAFSDVQAYFDPFGLCRPI